MPNTSRELTLEEVEDRFLQQVAATVRYWENENRAPSVREKLEGLAFSLLVILDGGAGFHPSCLVIPSPHPDDKQFAISQGENWYPQVAEDIPGDIAGGLHNKIGAYLRKLS